MIFPLANAGPRLTTSQQAIPTARGSGCGSQTHLTAPPGFVRSTAIRLLGKGVTTYIVLSMTSGCPSWPCGIPVLSVVMARRFCTLEVLIVLSGLYRRLPYSPAGMVQVPFASSATTFVVGGAPAGTPCGALGPGDAASLSLHPAATSSSATVAVTRAALHTPSASC